MLEHFRPNVPLPTLGGKQLWADRLHFRGWRIQEHAISGHCRLLDPRGVRRAWGSYDRCALRMGEAKERLALPPISGDAVVVLHGLGRTRAAMSRLACYLQDAGYEACNVSYPSTRYDVARNARNLAAIVDGLADANRVHLVGHSLGGIVIRHYLADRQARGGDGAPEIGRVVFLASPNQGATLAVRLAGLGLLRLVLGTSMAELGRDWRQLECRLAVPREFAIIAGCRGRDCGYNPLLTGDDDLVVSIEETKLEGAAGFLALPTLHSFIMKDPRALAQTAHFLKHGRFE